MIVTEEEAKTKRCQESFPSPMVSRTDSKWASPSHCIGSACMAWSWWFGNGSNLLDRSRDDDNSKGFCGKAVMR